MAHHAERLYDYHNWANKRIFEHLKTLPEEIYHQEITSVFPSISAVVKHIYSTDAMWLNVMRQKPFQEIYDRVMELREQINASSMAEMESRYADLNKEYHEFFKSVNLDKVITIQHPAFGSADAPISEQVQHVVNHGTYHRGNITAMLRQQGHPGVPTDYITYIF